MADCAEADSDLFWESCWSSPATMKRQKKSKKKKVRSDIITSKKDVSVQKKKKNSKFKETMKVKKDKKKKKTKKKRKMLGLDEGFIFTQSNNASDPIAQSMRPEQIPAMKAEASNPRSPEQPKHHRVNSDSLPKRNPKTKKKVAFDVMSGYIKVKRPKVVLPSTQLPQPNNNSLFKSQGVTGNVNLLTGQSQGQSQDNDSQCTGDDTYSQDLFITQKTFRVSSSETSSGESNKEGLTTTPLSLTQQARESHTPRTQVTLCHKESDTRLRDLQRQAQKLPQCRKVNRYLQEPLEVHTQTEGLHTTHQDRKKVNPCLQMPMEPRPKKGNSYLEEPMVVNTHLGVMKPANDFHTSNQKMQRYPTCVKLSHKLLPLPLLSTANTSTQTENFFTTELSSYLRFQQETRTTVNSEDLKPVDLSMPQRTRADPGRCSSDPVKTSVHEVEDEDSKAGDQKPSSSPIEIKDEDDKEPGGYLLYSAQIKNNKGKKQSHPAAPSPQSESGPKSSDTTTSSEDEPSWRGSKVDLTQVRAVQTKLNESFYFKTKGEGQLPRPESPLMKLTQGRETKSIKRQ